MGITGLLPFLQESSRNIHIEELRGLTVAIDSYGWLHKGAFGCAEKLVRGEATTTYVSYCMKYINVLLLYNIKPILVFDGQRLPAKKDTETKRCDLRKAAKSRGNELLKLGRVEEARHHFRQCIDVTHAMAISLIRVCRNKGIDCIVAPYEADAQLAYLNLKGIVDFVITEDSDLVMFGCTKIVFKFAIDGTGILVEKDKLNKSMKMTPVQYSFDKFRHMCILSGCDYLDSLPNIGLKRAHKAITMTHNPDIYKLLPRLSRYLNMNKLVVSDEYIEKFKIADATVKHQIVFDPIQRKLLPLTDPSQCDTDPKYLVCAGKMYDSDRALQLALGNIDPNTYKIIDDWNPNAIENANVIHGSCIWSKDYKKIKPYKEKVGHFKPLPRANRCRRVLAWETETVFNCGEDFDQKLNKELQMYEVPKEPPLKRQKVDDSVDVVSTSPIISNPFLNKQKRLSKFSSTEFDKNSTYVMSKFFTNPLKTKEFNKTATVLCDLKNPENHMNAMNDLNMNIEDESQNKTASLTSSNGKQTSEAFIDKSDGDNMESTDENHTKIMDLTDDDNARTSPVLSKFSRKIINTDNETLTSFKNCISIFQYDCQKKACKHEEGYKNSSTEVLSTGIQEIELNEPIKLDNASQGISATPVLRTSGFPQNKRKILTQPTITSIFCRINKKN